MIEENRPYPQKTRSTRQILGWKLKFYALLAVTALLMAVITLATTYGSIHIPFLTSLQVLASKLPFIDSKPTPPEVFGIIMPYEKLEAILIDIRLPRVILAGLTGASLSVAGATYQGLFRNPLADPYLLGISSGAGLGAAIAILLNLSLLGSGTIPTFAFLGGMTTIALVYWVAHKGSSLPVVTLVLAGVAISSFFSSTTSYLMTQSDEGLHAIIFWLLGGFSSSTWTEVHVVLPCFLIGFSVIWVHARHLNVMQLDEEQAQQLGINVERVKFVLLLAATFVTASAVAFTGTIGFVGIIIPHTVRLIWGPDYRFLLPLSVLTGAIFLILADLLARTVLSPQEIPVGVITSLCGAPFFLHLLRKKSRAIF